MVGLVPGRPDHRADARSAQRQRQARRWRDAGGGKPVGGRCTQPFCGREGVDPVEEAAELQIGAGAGVRQGAREPGDPVAHGRQPPDDLDAEILKAVEVEVGAGGCARERQGRQPPEPLDIVPVACRRRRGSRCGASTRGCRRRGSAAAGEGGCRPRASRAGRRPPARARSAGRSRRRRPPARRTPARPPAACSSAA